jgi:fatty acid-binding protein DegV
VSAVTICTDSSALLSASSAASLGVEIVPIAVALDGEPIDELTSSLDWFYERMRAGAQATTSQPSIGDFATVYERAVERGAQSIVSIHLDARISGTVSSAESAASAVEVPVLVVDTRTVSYGVGLCVRAAAAEVSARGRAGDAGRAASRLGAMLQNAFVVRGGPGGRIAPDEGWTLFRYQHGAASRISVCASLTEAVPAIVGLTLEDEVPICVAIGHAGREIEPAADELARRLRASGHAVGIERYRVGASVGAHTGADSFGLFWWPAP